MCSKNIVMYAYAHIYPHVYTNKSTDTRIDIHAYIQTSLHRYKHRYSEPLRRQGRLHPQGRDSEQRIRQPRVWASLAAVESRAVASCALRELYCPCQALVSDGYVT